MTFYDNAFEAEAGLIRRETGDRQNLMRHETEDFLRTLSGDYPARAAQYWPREFADSELISLVPPRPFVREEFERARAHYAKSEVEPGRMALDLPEGGHEVRVQTGLDSLGRWL